MNDKGYKNDGNKPLDLKKIRYEAVKDAFEVVKKKQNIYAKGSSARHGYDACLANMKTYLEGLE